MASIRLDPPEKFDFKQPDKWSSWRARFEQYRIASGLSDEAEKRQVCTLLYCLGPGAEGVLAAMSVTDDERKTYSTVLDKLDQFFKVRRNIIFERARFNLRYQQPGETADEYIAALYVLADTCEYGDFKKQMLRDRLVVGILDRALSQRMQLDADLTLDSAMKLVRQKEAVKEHDQVLTGDGSKANPILLEDVTKDNADAKRGTKGSVYQPKTKLKPWKRLPRNNPQIPQGGPCNRCGKSPSHPRRNCPAKDAECHRCKRKGHFRSQCRTKEVGSVDDQDSHLLTAYLDNLTGSAAQPWTAQVAIGQVTLLFKVDTGADVTAISEEAFQSLKDVTIHKSARKLYGPNRTQLKVIGQFTHTITYNNRSSSQEIYVVKGLKRNLLGLPAIMELHIAARLDTVSDPSSTFMKAFPKVFQGLGSFGKPYQILLKTDAKPFALYSPRRVPLALRKAVKSELERMQKLGVISPVETATEWCAGMVVVPKTSGQIRICVDLKPLNRSVKREVFPLPRVDEILAQIAGATTFSKLDANSGFWQIPLARESRPLTTFITPFGRFQFNKLPFGITSAPELFQRRMAEILHGLQGVMCLIDDVLVYGKTEEEHDKRLLAVLNRLETAGVTLNSRKCSFRQSSIQFLGHVVDNRGISADPRKTAAIRSMERPSSVTELRRFLGMMNQLGKFSSKLAHLSQPLRELLSNKCTWHWDEQQETAFNQIKDELSKPTVLHLYDPNAETKVSADASSFGIGAVLLQKDRDLWKPTAYASRALSEVERRYAQIEKEGLALAWACDRFAEYILGKHILLETDHKPLIPLFGTKHLDSLPPRVLRFRLRLDRFDYRIEHVPGKDLNAADALSRAPLRQSENLEALEEVQMFTDMVSKGFPASHDRLLTFSQAQREDAVCSQLLTLCRDGWPGKYELTPELRQYWQFRGSLSIVDELLMFGCRIVIPQKLRKEVLSKIHDGHLGVQKCQDRARESTWWPGIMKDIEEEVRNCRICAEHYVPAKEPLMQTSLPPHPWHTVGADLFYLKEQTYLLVVDYYSRYPEVHKLTNTTSKGVITAMKEIFSRQGIPFTVRSDNGPQFDSEDFRDFAEEYGFNHPTSSPHHPQGNGFVERGVKTMKQLLQKSPYDPYRAVLNYRASPLPWCRRSPSELLMGRKLRTTLPVSHRQLCPKWEYTSEFEKRDREFKRKQKENFDKRHRVRDLPPLDTGDSVIIRTGKQTTPGVFMFPAASPRSFVVDTPTGSVRRNRQHLVSVKDEPPMNTDSSPAFPTGNINFPQVRSPIMTRSRTGTAIHPPDKLNL